MNWPLHNSNSKWYGSWVYALVKSHTSRRDHISRVLWIMFLLRFYSITLAQSTFSICFFYIDSAISASYLYSLLLTVWWGIGNLPWRVWWYFWYEPREWRSFCGEWDAPVCNVVEEGWMSSYIGYLKEGRRENIAFIIEKAFCHLTKKIQESPLNYIL